MNKIIPLSLVGLMTFGTVTFADKVMITGEPVTLEHTGDVYQLPDDYSVTTSYHYVTVNDTKRVCYAEKQPNFASLDVIDINVKVGGSEIVWHCYEYNPTYFEITS
ncbi:hypothetical protein [Legionella yabuuchiae]|uniref:hypothetical protein n=1 Tax=Legionella yabuuchiae TaxID=376727 RepID=UPI001055BE77|nr:hypothetical protein [Legionella yabuuchiae]